MLTSLAKFREQLSKNRGDWDDIIDIPKVEYKTKKGLELKNYVLEIIFDLDNQDINVDAQNLKEYDELSPVQLKNINIQGGNNKAIYACVESNKLEQFRKTFFGTIDKNGKQPEQGQFQELIKKDFIHLKQTQLYQTLKEIFSLSPIFTEQYINFEKESAGVIDYKNIFSNLNLSLTERIVLVYASVKSNKLQLAEPIPITHLEGYDEFIKAKFFSKSNQLPGDSGGQKLCYATGLKSAAVAGLGIAERYSLNKMFVTTTFNYAANLNNKAFDKNYQVSQQAQLYLERASKYILEKYKTRIAGIDHCIIPTFLHKTDIDYEFALSKIKNNADLLFQTIEIKTLSENIEAYLEDDEVYWITFMAFESDGNFFKTINLIKDISSRYFKKVIETFHAVGWEMRSFIGGKYTFNLQSIYSLIPLRKDKEKKNEALLLFKSILEGRKIERELIYKHFVNLILCHKFGRYESFTNIWKNENFDFAIKDAVFKYAAFMHALESLKLLKNMEETEEIIIPEENETTPGFQQKIEQFFAKMHYTEDQKALFYLGRVLSSVAYAQYQKGYETKPVMNKLNYNGMDKKDIIRLRKDLSEKTKQYNIFGKTEGNLSRFTQYFKLHEWEKRMKPEESIFFILSGYSFGLVK